MESNQQGPSAPLNDLPPPYSAVVGNNPQYGFVPAVGGFVPPTAGFVPPAAGFVPPAGGYVPPGGYPAEGIYPPPKTFTAPGVYPHPPMTSQSQGGDMPPQPPGLNVPVGIVLPQELGSEPTTVTCYNCHKTVTTRVTYTTAWHTHLVAGSVCIITMMCSLCCLGLVPYCFDTFKDSEHYCPNCNSFIGKNNKC